MGGERQVQVRQSLGVAETDSELRQERDIYAKERFGKTRFRDLSAPERIKVARYLRHKFLCSKRQLARIVQLKFETIEKAI